MIAKASSIAVTIPRGAFTTAGRLQKVKRLVVMTLLQPVHNKDDDDEYMEFFLVCLYKIVEFEYDLFDCF